MRKVKERSQAVRPPPDLSVDDKRNWHFNDLPEDEVEACCWWEYARESAFIRRVQDSFGKPRVLKYLIAPKGPVPPTWKDWQTIRLSNQHLFELSYDLTPKTFWGTARPARYFPQPWQAIPPATRRGKVPAPEEKPEGFTHLTDKTLDAILARVVNYWHLTRRAPNHSTRLSPSEIFRRTAQVGITGEVGAFQVQWGQYTNDQLVQIFRRWASKNRPKGLPMPDHRGHKQTDFRVALDRLATMRLLHHYTPSEVPVAAPQLWKRYKGKDFFRARTAALIRFQQMFSPLWDGERPLSWSTKAGRTR